MKRNKLLAYFIGAGVAGTILVFPYIGMAVLKTLVPRLHDVYIPYFLLPLFWGFWNWLYIRLRQPFAICVWGALLGVILGIGFDVLLYVNGQWHHSLEFLPIIAGAFYYIIWDLIIGPFNNALDV